MAGGLMQLVAYGAQDVYLTGNPKVTFFQAVYRRHTNFAMENIEQTVNGTAADSGLPRPENASSWTPRALGLQNRVSLLHMGATFPQSRPESAFLSCLCLNVM